MGLSAISFDIWDTILIDDSDEPKRAAQGLRSKPEERRHFLWDALNRQAPIERDVIDAAFDTQEVSFRAKWYNENITMEVSERLDIMLKELGRELPDDEFTRLVTAYETMEIGVPPDLIEGAADIIAELAEHYKLCIVSDAIYTPGKHLRNLLAHHGIKKFFSGFVFSDEIGRAKPHPDCFIDAARQVDSKLSEMVHIGDRDVKDVAGPQALGMKAILFTGSRDEGSRDTTKAEGIAQSYSELAGVIDSLAKA